MVSASMTSFQQWSSKSRAMMCSCLSGDRPLRRQYQRMASGLTDAFDSDPRRVDLRQRCDFGNRGLEIGYGLRVGHVVADVATVKRRLIRMLVEEVRCDADEPVAREALGEI